MGHIPIRTVAFALIALPLSAVSLAQPYGVGEFESEFLQTGLKHWHAVNNTTSFAGGADHVGIASDGSHIWVTNLADGTISKLRANDGTLLRNARGWFQALQPGIRWSQCLVGQPR